MRKPNIILIMASQVRWDGWGYAGNTDVRTPNLDVLASHATVFEQAFAACPDAAATRATLLTGHFPSRHGVQRYGQALRGGLHTLPALLRMSGYETGFAGMLQATPTRAGLGFDRMALAEPLAPGCGEDDYHAWLRDEDPVSAEKAPSALDEKFCSTTWVGDRAVRGICTMTEPFFLWVSFAEPRPPFAAPATFDGMYDRRKLRLPAGVGAGVNETALRNSLAHYYTHISLMDRQIGRILATLTARGITDNVIVFTGDFGHPMGEHGLLEDNGVPFEATMRIPLLIAGVVRQRRGIREDALVEQADLMPTLLHIAGIRRPRPLAGETLAPLLLGAGAKVRNAAYAETGGGARMVRTQRYKLVVGEGGGLPALYDLRDDPHELCNRYGDPGMSAVQEDLHRELRRRAASV